jgi:hypothetical protein
MPMKLGHLKMWARMLEANKVEISKFVPNTSSSTSTYPNLDAHLT